MEAASLNQVASSTTEYESRTAVHAPLRSGVISYKFALVSLDVLVALAVALAEIGFADHFSSSFRQLLLICVCATPIVFFPTFNLYSYHRIFSRRYHLSGLVKTFAYSLLTFGVLALNYVWTDLLPADLFLPVVVGLVLALLIFQRMYEDQTSVLLKSFGLACLAIGGLGITGPHENPAISRYALPLLLSATALGCTRYVVVHYFFNQQLRRRFRRQVLLIGADEDAERIVAKIIQHNAPFWVAGTVSTCGDCRLNTVVEKTSLGKIQDLEAILGENFFQEAFITDEGLDKPELIRLLDFFTSRGINVWFSPKLMPILGIKLKIDELLGIRMVRLRPKQFTWLFRKCKYAFDAVSAIVISSVFLPVFAFVALVIKLTSEGPVFYRPTAVGKGGRHFKMYKFRSMITGASSAVHREFVTRMIRGELTQDGSGKTLKIVNDPRITWIGRILRKTSMDEIPQLLNVMKGEMSLVGPRPCLPYEYEVYKEWHKKRTAVRPGITGLWQVVGRSEVSFEDMILLDLYYIYNRSVHLDLTILFETLFVVIKRKGAH
jgi:exopolysaccharide biosynthesis polyprenyl glycosylphosphotransferase